MSDEGLTFELTPVQPKESANRWAPLLVTVVAMLVVAGIIFFLDWWDHKVETNTLLLALLPVLIWLLAAGKVSKFKAFGVELDAVIEQVATESVGADRALLDSSPIQYEAVGTDLKEAVSKIDRFIQRRMPALSFKVGFLGYYDAQAMDQYMEKLTPHDFFKWVVFVDQQGAFRGMVPAETFRASGTRPERMRTYDSMVRKIEEDEVADLRGFVGVDSALTVRSSKGEAIKRFSEVDTDNLPVVHSNLKFAGVLNRGKLHSSLLASVFRTRQVGE